MDFQEIEMYVNTKIIDVLNPVYNEMKKTAEEIVAFKLQQAKTS